MDDPVLGHGEDGRPLFRSELVAGDWASQERMVASARELADTMDQLLDWPDNADLRHAVEELADAYARQDPRAARDAEIRYLGCLYRLKETGVLE